MMKMTLASAALLALLPVSAARALPVLPPAAPAADSAVIKVHGCHRSCEWGPVLRWHRHGAYCRAIACVPRAVFPGRCFVDRYGVRRCRW